MVMAVYQVCQDTSSVTVDRHPSGSEGAGGAGLPCRFKRSYGAEHAACIARSQGKSAEIHLSSSSTAKRCPAAALVPDFAADAQVPDPPKSKPDLIVRHLGATAAPFDQLQVKKELPTIYTCSTRREVKAMESQRPEASGRVPPLVVIETFLCISDALRFEFSKAEARLSSTMRNAHDLTKGTCGQTKHWAAQSGLAHFPMPPKSLIRPGTTEIRRNQVKASEFPMDVYEPKAGLCWSFT